MKQTKILNDLLGTTSKVEILRVLFESDDAMTGRRIAATAGISPRSCQLSLDSLVKQRALYRKAVGRAYSYTLNRDHRISYDILRPIFEQEKVVHKEAAKLLQQACRSYGSKVLGIWWKLDRKKKTETLSYTLIVDDKKSVPAKDLMSKIDDSLADRFGFNAKGTVFTKNEFLSKQAGTVSARDRFEKAWTKAKGSSLADLAGAKK